MPANGSGGDRIGTREALPIGKVLLSPASCEVAVDGGAVQRLEPKVMQVLTYFAERQGRVLTRDDLIEGCWGGRIVSEDAVHRVIGRIRRVLTPTSGVRLETIPKVGFRMLAARSPDAVTASGDGRLASASHARRTLSALAGRRGVGIALGLGAAGVAALMVGALTRAGAPERMPRLIVWTYDQGKRSDAPNGLRFWRAGPLAWQETYADGAVRNLFTPIAYFRLPINGCRGLLLRRDTTLLAFVPDRSCQDRRIMAEDIDGRTGEVKRPWFTLGEIQSIQD